MPKSKSRIKSNKKPDFNKEKINKIVKTYTRLIENYLPILNEVTPVENTPYNLSKARGLRDLTLLPIHISAITAPFLHVKIEENEKEEVLALIQDRLKVMLSLHIMLDIMPDDVVDVDFLEKLKYYYGLVLTYYKLEKVPITKNPPDVTFVLRDELITEMN